MTYRLLAAVALLSLSHFACSGDEETSTASQAAGSPSGSGATGSGASGSGGASGGTATGTGGSVGGSGGAPSGAGGGVGSCDGKACGSACMSEAGEGMCDGGGSCVVVAIACDGYAPCEGAQCGTACASCDPTDPTCVPVPTAVCDITGMCIYPPPACD